MNAKVKPGAWGKWLAYCEECSEGIGGTMAQVDLWADFHNGTHYEAPQPLWEAMDCQEATDDFYEDFK